MTTTTRADFDGSIAAGHRVVPVLRRLFAAWWHRDEVEFRDWYAALVNRFDGNRGDLPYATWVEILELPEEVRGYRSVRGPKMAAARQRAAELLSGRPPATAPGTLSIEPVRASG